jgi:hypothetical protein
MRLRQDWVPIVSNCEAIDSAHVWPRTRFVPRLRLEQKALRVSALLILWALPQTRQKRNVTLLLILRFSRRAEACLPPPYSFSGVRLAESFEFRFGVNAEQTNESQPGRV